MTGKTRYNVAPKTCVVGVLTYISDEVLFIYEANGLGLDKTGRLHTCEERT